jgi:hypothetical protein
LLHRDVRYTWLVAVPGCIRHGFDDAEEEDIAVRGQRRAYLSPGPGAVLMLVELPVIGQSRFGFHGL